MNTIAGIWRLGQDSAPDAVHSFADQYRIASAPGFMALCAGQSIWHSADLFPFEAATGDVIISADARIDNRHDLLRRLALAEDTRLGPLLYHMYRRWGVDMAAQLLGDYAIAIWDGSQQRLILMRDHMGTRPLYVYQQAGTVAFASDLHQLLALSTVQTSVDEAIVAAYLRGYDAYGPSQTFFKHVEKIPAAALIQINADGQRQQRLHWSPENVTPIHYDQEQTYIEHALSLLDAAVACRADLALPVGAHVTGGLDGGLVTYRAARQVPPEQLTLLSWGHSLAEQPPISDQDERYRIGVIASALNKPCHYIAVNEDTALAELQLDPAFYPQAQLGDELPVMVYAQQHGIRLILSGWGGDEALTYDGRGFAAAQFLKGRWRIALSAARVTSALRRRRFKLAGKQAWYNLLVYLLPDPVLHRFEMARRGPTAENLMQPGLRHAALDLPQRPFTRLYADDRRNQIALLSWGHLTHRIEAWAHLGRDYGLDYAYPLLDKRILEFALAIDNSRDRLLILLDNRIKLYGI